MRSEGKGCILRCASQEGSVYAKLNMSIICQKIEVLSQSFKHFSNLFKCLQFLKSVWVTIWLCFSSCFTVVFSNVILLFIRKSVVLYDVLLTNLHIKLMRMKRNTYYKE